MGKKGRFDYADNAQISMDANLPIMVVQPIRPNANDQQEVEPAPAALQEATARLPAQLSADNGYFSGGNLQAWGHRRIDAYIATDKGEKTHKIPVGGSDRNLVKADVEDHEADNVLICPQGQVLTMKRESHDGRRAYQGASEVCAERPLQSCCCPSAKGEARTYHYRWQRRLRQQMNAKIATEPAKALYGNRKTIVGPVLGQIKNSGFRGSRVRGKEKVAGEFSLVCATHQFKKIAKAIFTGLIRPRSASIFREI